MAVELDEVDKELLRMLQNDARISFAEMARRLRIAESTVRFRVKRLVNKGVIKRFTALIDPRKIGLPITLIVMVKVSSEMLGEAFNALASFKEAHHVFQSTGRYDVAAIFHARDMNHVNELVNELRMIRGVREAEVMVATGLIKIETRLRV